MKMRLGSILLCCALAFTLLPWSVLPAQAGESVTYSGFTADDGTGYAAVGESYDKLVDGKLGTKWYADISSTPSGETQSCLWIDFSSADPIQVDSYSLTTGGDTSAYSDRNPATWVLKGKAAADGDWQTIASVTDDTTLQAVNNTTYTFPLDTPGTYQYFRFMVLGNRSGSPIAQGNGVQLMELTLSCSQLPDLSNATVSGLQSSYAYTGAPIDLAYTVTSPTGKTLQKGTDFTETITPSPVRAVGDYTLTITGNGNYYGTHTFSFRVCDGMNAVANGDTVWFGMKTFVGNDPGTQVGMCLPWRVLSTAGDAVLPVSGDGAALLISEYVLDDTDFDPYSPYSNVWADSLSKAWCEALYAGWPDDAEKAAITATAVTETENYNGSWQHEDFGPASLIDEHFFFLSVQEAETYFDDNNDRISHALDEYGYVDIYNAYHWWLRSPCASSVAFVGLVTGFGHDGRVDITGVYGVFGARPAFNLDPACVLLASAARDGKSGVTGTLAPLPDNGTGEWKLTLLDENRVGFAVTEKETTVCVGGSVRLTYSGARTGEKEYISALLCDADGAAVGYGTVQADAASGTADFTLPGSLTPGSYTLKVFNEQRNGNYESDYAGNSADIELTVLSASVSGSVGGNNLAWTVTAAPAGSLLLAARYENGRMTCVKTLEPLEGDSSGTLTMGGSGTEFKLMLADKTTLAPLCEAWSS